MDKMPAKVTVKRLIDGLTNLVNRKEIFMEDRIDWAYSIDTGHDAESPCDDGDFHPVGTILFRIVPLEGESGIASIEPEHVSKKLN